jgi:predicted transcriptional regulator of viral defense system
VTSLKILRQLPQLFRYADVEKFTGSANVFLTRALKRGLIGRIARGVYVNDFLKNRPEIEEVACFLRTPSYISCEWALNRHGLLLQSPVVCTVLTLSTAVGSSRNLEYGGITIEFSHIAARLFTGFETRSGYNLAFPEKALLDTIYLRKAIPFRDELNLELLDRRKLELLADLYPVQTGKLARELILSENTPRFTG